MTLQNLSRVDWFIDGANEAPGSTTQVIVVAAHPVFLGP